MQQVNIQIFIYWLAGEMCIRDRKRAAFYDVPAKDYLEVLKIRALREMGRTAESRALLETVKKETANDLTRQALKTEEEQLP